MQFHYYTLVAIAKHLNENYQNSKLLSCFSQNKNEVVIEWENLFLRVGCNTPLTFLVPVKEYAKAGKNVVTLFEAMQGLHFQRARVLPYERILILELSEGYEMILKMHNIQANVLLRKKGEILEMLNNDIEKDEVFEEVSGNYFPENIEKLADLDTKDEKEILAAIREISNIYDKKFTRRILFRVEKGENLKNAFLKTVAEANDNQFYVGKDEKGVHFYLFPTGENCVKITGVENALFFFLRVYYQFSGYQNQYNKLEKIIAAPYKNLQKVYDSYQTSIYKLENDRSMEEIGHLLMANLHLLEQGMKEISLEDFYNEGKILKIKLKEELNPQENAKEFYNKSKERKAKLAYLKGEISNIEDKIFDAAEKMEDFEKIVPPKMLVLGENGFVMEQLKSLKKFDKEEKVTAPKQKPPFKCFEKDGWEIFVGRNSENNDQLSFKFASKDDIWLHAKDVAGSHVVIRTKMGQKLPETVLEYAAGLAAWFSKRRNETLAPVTYTPRKFIRKRKGDAPGQVVVTKEEVVLVEPVKV
jgi:predicted ribosome quality control (RQC) complex YloA/Tae2 family protein